MKPTEKYRELLVKAEVLSESDHTIIDPTNRQLHKEKNIIVLQQGEIHWYHWADEMKQKVKFAITPNVLIYKDLISKGVKSFLLEFPIEDKYQIETSWNDRVDAIYYHGRILPGKVNIEDLKKIIDAGIQIVMRGPVCKHYWVEEDLEGEEYEKFRDEFFKLASSGKVDLETPRYDEQIIIDDLNWFKFYFTLSNGESFNVGLEEAIACGTIPIVRHNGAYWWAHHMLVNFVEVEKLIKTFEQYRNEDLEEYSDLIAREIKKRCSLEAIKEKFEYQKTHAI